MSVKEAGKPNSGPFSFSDQISSRLQRWVQRTSYKRRDGEKAPTTKARRESNHVKDKDLDIKKCTPQEPFTKNSRDTRTIQELEKALKDLINNCVTNSKGISFPTNNNEAKPSFVGDEVQIKMDVVKENDNIDEVCRSETNTDSGTNIDGQSVRGKYGKNLNSEVLLPSGFAKVLVTDWETVRLSGTELEGVSQQLSQTTTGIQQHGANSRRSISNENELILSVSSQADQEHIKINEKLHEGPNHISKNVGTSWVNISARNANNGLNAGSSNKNGSGRLSKSGYNSPLNSSKSRTTEGIKTNEKNATRKQKPPLRRIQSEGDAIEKRLSFKDRDVKEFAETCIRHAQRKRFSETASLESNPDFFNCDLTGTETDEHYELVSLSSPKFDAPRNDLKPSPPAKDHRNVFELEPFWTGTSSMPHYVKNTTATAQHKPASGRPSSISFPLEKTKTRNISKHSFFKPKNTSKSLNSSPTSPQSAISPKFKKFPHQPMFYVPKASDGSPQLMSKNDQSGSLTESSSTYGHSEHLI